MPAPALSPPARRSRPRLSLATALATALAAALAGCTAPPGGASPFGAWSASLEVEGARWSPGQTVTLRAVLTPPERLELGMAERGYPVDAVVMLVTAERTFDADGWMRLPSDERMSTLLTPTGLPIEGGVQGAVTTRFGYAFRTPVDELLEQPPGFRAVFTPSFTLPADLPPGLYRLRVDFGVRSGKRYLDLAGNAFASRPFLPAEGTYLYTGAFPASGRDAAGREVDATALQARVPWTLLAAYNSNGYQGVVADEDRARFGLSGRSLIQDEVILPLTDGGGRALAYGLEPALPADTIDPRSAIAWDFGQGELALDITAPDGTHTVVPPTPIAGRTAAGFPTTGQAAFTAWKPPGYGHYTVRLTGWMADLAGRRYTGGGTYHFWIARRLTMATATFQGMAYPVGSRYGRDIAFAPPVPADVTVTATLYPGSDPAQARSVQSAGRATAGGLFGAGQGLQQLALDAPGEYAATILARYTDPDGALWVCAMRHAGVVYPPDTTLEAHGKKLHVGSDYLDRGATGREGYVDAGGAAHLEHLTFPYQPGDLLLIASDGQGANKIEPVLTARAAGDPSAWDARLNGVGTSNLALRTSNGYSPHLFPEYIVDRQYYYASAARPGFMGRFLVGESNVRAPYWSTSPNGFGGQIGASPNGDLPGDLYRLMGGVVKRDQGQAPAYAGYLATAALLPRGSNDNRVVAPGSEDLVGATGERARFFLVGFRPGMALELGATWRPAVQVDPLLPAAIHLVLTYPDGRQQVVDGTADATGSFAGPAAYPLDVPGIYRYQLSATWNGHAGRMPGLPDAGGEFYVFPPRPAGAAGLAVDLPTQSSFSAAGQLTVSGHSSASSVRYALLMPGAVLAQGDLPVVGGAFHLVLDPAQLHAAAPIYDIASVSSGKPQIGRVLHLSLFAEEAAPDGGRFWDFRRVIVRGTTVISAR